jgi:hypothetical protein
MRAARLNSPIRTLFVGADVLGEADPLRLSKEGRCAETCLGRYPCLLVATYECSEDTPLQPALAPR